MIVKKRIRVKILKYYSSLPESEFNSEMREVVTFLHSHPLTIFPYQFHFNYKPDAVKVFRDDQRRMHYVYFDNKKLYFRKSWGPKKVANWYSNLQREQDMKSPHRYLTGDFNVTGNDIIADIGAAEGNFSLSVVDRVKKVYIFEYNRQWAEALGATFSPWKEKVEIINKRVAPFDDSNHLRFDTFFNKKRDITFLKIDVDGEERQVLEGCKPLLSQTVPLRIALCSYHRNEDEKEFTSLLSVHGFKVTTSAGYMVHYYDKQMKAPYLRRGIIRAERK